MCRIRKANPNKTAVLALILLCVFGTSVCFGQSADANVRLQTKVTYSCENLPMEVVLKELAQQAGVFIMTLPETSPCDVAVEDLTIAGGPNGLIPSLATTLWPTVVRATLATFHHRDPVVDQLHQLGGPPGVVTGQVALAHGQILAPEDAESGRLPERRARGQLLRVHRSARRRHTHRCARPQGPGLAKHHHRPGLPTRR